jgi:hypothetical protein
MNPAKVGKQSSVKASPTATPLDDQPSNCGARERREAHQGIGEQLNELPVPDKNDAYGIDVALKRVDRHSLSAERLVVPDHSEHVVVLAVRERDTMSQHRFRNRPGQQYD